jgi:predicted nucleic acid-binding protein
MPVKVFFDTNVIVYGFDKTAPAKRAIARRLIRERQDWAISWQVVQEFCNVALHRFVAPMAAQDLREFLDLMLLPHCRIYPTPDLYRNAVRIQSETHYHFHDSLIIASAITSGANLLYSEDMRSGQMIGDLLIENPFAS